MAGGGLAGLFGMVSFIADIPFSHEILAGMMLSLALALAARNAPIGGLLLATCAVALRELALPFLLAWGAERCGQDEGVVPLQPPTASPPALDAADPPPLAGLGSPVDSSQTALRGSAPPTFHFHPGMSIESPSCMGTHSRFFMAIANTWLRVGWSYGAAFLSQKIM